MNISWFLALLGLIVIGIIVNNLQKPLTPNLYVFNTYMYILLAIIIIATTWTIGDTQVSGHNLFDFEGYQILGVFILSLLFLFGTILSTNRTITHCAWFLFVVTIGMMTYVYYRTQAKSDILRVFISLLVLIGILSWISYTKPLDTFDNWFNPMMLILVGLIIVQTIDLIFFYDHGTQENFLTRFRIYSWIGLILFSGFLLYDTQKLIKNSEIVAIVCTNREQSQCANYPVESLSLFLDITNLFTSMSNLSN